MNGTAQSDMLDRYLKNMRESGKSLTEIKENLEKHLLEGSQLPFHELIKSVYALTKLGELLSLIDDMIQKDIDFRNPLEEGSGTETKAIPDNPEQESQHIRDLWKEKAWKEVIPR